MTPDLEPIPYSLAGRRFLALKTYFSRCFHGIRTAARQPSFQSTLSCASNALPVQAAFQPDANVCAGVPCSDGALIAHLQSQLPRALLHP